VLEGAEFETDWEKLKIQQLGIGNEGKKPSEISYSQIQDIKTQRWNRIESSHCHYNQITNGGKMVLLHRIAIKRPEMALTGNPIKFCLKAQVLYRMTI